mgnify:FL=1
MTGRREFLALTGAALASGACVTVRVSSRRDYDLVIRGGTVFDGLGGPGRAMDVGITGGRVAAMGPSLSAGREEIDARGLAVTPGFIDIHSHGDGNMDEDPRQESVVRQGITTIVVGQIGRAHV